MLFFCCLISKIILFSSQIYQPPCCSSYQCCHQNKPHQAPHINNTNKKPMHTKYLNSLNANDSFTSLPPAIPFSGEDSPTQRRFSDPGIFKFQLHTGYSAAIREVFCLVG